MSSLASVSELDELSEKGSIGSGSQGSIKKESQAEAEGFSEKVDELKKENESKSAALEYLDLMKKASNPQKMSILAPSKSEDRLECIMF